MKNSLKEHGDYGDETSFFSGRFFVGKDGYVNKST